MQKSIVIIPSLNPDEKLIHLIKQLSTHPNLEIIIVDDGSTKQSSLVFDKVSDYACKVLTHPINLGKGQALKTAFKYILQNYSDDVTIVCADADGQHCIEDILQCLKVSIEHPNSLVMGCRKFDTKAIPFRSRFGNNLTRRIFKMLCGVKVSDTQTGLRAMSVSLMRQFITVKGDRFEYEMNMLIETGEQQIPIIEVPIKTIYIEENKTSHFNPLLDSLRIYRIFSKFILSSTISFLIDIFLFSFFIFIFDKLDDVLNIFLSTVFSRLISSFANYTINRKTVFKTTNEHKFTLVKYYILCVIQLLSSAFLVNVCFSFIRLPEVIIKLAVDIVLFVISFQIQRGWVFKTIKK